MLFSVVVVLDEIGMGDFVPAIDDLGHTARRIEDKLDPDGPW